MAPKIEPVETNIKTEPEKKEEEVMKAESVKVTRKHIDIVNPNVLIDPR